MSRSRKKTPIHGITKASSDKLFKKQEHKRARANRRSRQDEPHEKEFGNPCSSQKDGKQYIDPDVHPKLMRK